MLLGSEGTHAGKLPALSRAFGGTAPVRFLPKALRACTMDAAIVMWRQSLQGTQHGCNGY